MFYYANRIDIKLLISDTNQSQTFDPEHNHHC